MDLDSNLQELTVPYLETMEIEKMAGIKRVELVSVTRRVNTDDNESAIVTYHRGDPEFDTFEQEEIELRRQFRLMTRQENGLPNDFVSWGEGEAYNSVQICAKIKNVFVHFYQGYADEKSVKSTITEIVADLRSSYINKGYDEAEFMPKLIEDVYDYARLCNIRGAGNASWYEGRALAAAQNGSAHNWVYYDADYYYQSEEMKSTLIDITKDIASKFGVDSSALELPTEYPEGDLRKSIYSSYNTFINEYLRTDCRIGSLIDETIVPPQGLRFFYCGNGSGTNSLVSQLPAPLDEPEAFFDATLSVWYGDWSFVGRVPVRQDPYRFPISVNAFDVVAKGSTSGIPNEVKDFLHNLDCFTKTQSQNYIDSHPRKF